MIPHESGTLPPMGSASEAGAWGAGARPPRGGRARGDRYGSIGQPPWTWAQTLLGTAIMLVPWVAIIVVSQVTAPRGGAPTTGHLTTGSDAVGGVLAFLFTALVEGAFLLVPAYYALWRRAPGISARDGLRALGIRGMRVSTAAGAVVVGLVIILAADFVYSVIVTAFQLPLRTNTTVLIHQAQYAPLTTLGELAGAVLIAPLCEEIFFRGFLFAGLLQRVSLWPAALLAALLFAVAHGDIGSFAVLFVIGVVLALVRWRAGSIWPSVALHGLNNLLAAVSVLAVVAH